MNSSEQIGRTLMKGKLIIVDVFERSPNEQCRTFGQRIRLFYNHRRPLEERLTEAVADTSSLVVQYVKIVGRNVSLLALPSSI